MRPVVLLLLALATVAIPHAVRVPFWVPPLALTLGVWRLHLERARKRLPGRFFLLFLAILGALAVLASLPVPLGRDAALSMLILLTGLKLLEMRGERDRLVVVFLGYFLAITNFLYDQSIPMAVVMGAAVVLLTAAWIDLVGTSGRSTLAENLRLSTRMLLQALPTAAALFFFFPRLSGPLWGLPPDAHGAGTGLSETMSPGSIGQVTLSDAVAFRVTFVGEAPPPEARYWRALVLDTTDGATWGGAGSRASTSGRGPKVGVDPRGLGELVAYSVSLEPHEKNWLPALELPTAAPDGAGLTPEYTLVAQKPVTERLRCALSSQLRFHTGALAPEERSRALQLPPRLGVQTRALAQTWKAQSGRDEHVLDRALEHFRRGGYVYTLSPPVLGRDPFEEFLFRSKRGFCEHYAGAFTLLMRLAGVPARVVTGYQGGEWNPLGGYWIVRQADAHAWSEVWLLGRGWVRVDPTAEVAPERVEFRIDNRLGAGGSAVRFLSGSGGLLRAVRHLRHAWDSVNNGWNDWMVGYDPERQYAVFSRLGVGDTSWRAVGVVIGLSVGLLLVVAALETMGSRKTAADPARRLYDRYCGKLARRGIPRLPEEGPWSYAERVVGERKELAAQVREITDLYVRQRYGTVGAREQLKMLARRVYRFRP